MVLSMKIMINKHCTIEVLFATMRPLPDMVLAGDTCMSSTGLVDFMDICCNCSVGDENYGPHIL